MEISTLRWDSLSLYSGLALFCWILDGGDTFCHLSGWSLISDGWGIQIYLQKCLNSKIVDSEVSCNLPKAILFEHEILIRDTLWERQNGHKGDAIQKRKIRGSPTRSLKRRRFGSRRVHNLSSFRLFLGGCRNSSVLDKVDVSKNKSARKQEWARICMIAIQNFRIVCPSKVGRRSTPVLLIVETSVGNKSSWGWEILLRTSPMIQSLHSKDDLSNRLGYSNVFF